MERMKLKNETEFAEVKGHWLKTYNTAYPLLMAMMILWAFQPGKELFDGLLMGLLLCGAAFLVKGKTAKWKKQGLRYCSFTLESELTPEEIKQRAANALLPAGIEITSENDELVFKGKTASYTYVYSKDTHCFSLFWHYSLKKAFSPFRYQYITDYREVLNEIGTIAYYIQNL